ncbi:DUF6493 family protein [Phnomibacter sp. MR]|uniref:DUF6493 family protein n=1 Tax=Phnomibacter sp. MR TaxID=3042318 RepID=UPI003A805722
MDLKDQLPLLLKQGKPEPWLQFFQTNDFKKFRSLAPTIKQLAKEYLEYVEVNNGLHRSWKQKANDTQRDMLLYGAFFCYNQAEFSKFQFSQNILEAEKLNKVIDWFCPTWFSDFVNRLADSNRWWQGEYQQIANLEEKGFVDIGPALSNKLLPSLIYQRSDRQHQRYTPELLLAKPITIQKHFWWLFEYESFIYHADRWVQFKDQPNVDFTWIGTILRLAVNGHIERQKLIIESLSASHRNFNKLLSGWFIDLHTALKPSIDELFNQQGTIFSIMHAPNSKPITYAVKLCKQLAKHPQFDKQAWLDHAPLLLVSDTKAIALGAIAVSEILLKADKRYADDLLPVLCQVFIQQNDELQSKAAQLIVKYKPTEHELLEQTIETYAAELTVSAKQLLEPAFPHAFSTTSTALSLQEESALNSEDETDILGVSIPPINNFDDLIFLLSQAFDNNEPWHASWVMNTLAQQQHLFEVQQLDAMQPVLQKALRIMSQGNTGKSGSIDYWMSILFIDVCIHWVRKHPLATSALQQLLKTNETRFQKAGKTWLAISKDRSYLELFNKTTQNNCLEVYRQLMLFTLECVKTGNALPLLSTPTYCHGWLLPSDLIERLILHEKTCTLANDLDMQIAMARCMLKNAGKYEKEILAIHDEETKRLLRYLFGICEVPEGNIFQYKSLWLMACMCRPQKVLPAPFIDWTVHGKKSSVLLGHSQFSVEMVEEEEGYWDNSTNKYAHRKVMKARLVLVESQDEPRSTSVFQRMTQMFSKSTKQDVPTNMLPLMMSLKGDIAWGANKDMLRYFFLSPNHAQPLLGNLMKNFFIQGDYSSQSDRDSIIACLQGMMLSGAWQSEGSHWFIAASLVYKDKTAAGVAAELWSLATATQHGLHQSKLGFALGDILGKGYAPLKRITDLLQQQMFKISAKHNQALLELIEPLLQSLPDEPQTNLKKLLELYREILCLCGSSKTSDGIIIEKLKLWSVSASVAPIAAKLL